jgi:hypothetical protein
MTETEAEIFIAAVSGYGDSLSVTDVRKKYRDVTLQAALEENLGEIARHIDLKQIEAD